jgi:NAD/NADP transhydrogenase alpha subunit
VVVRKAIVSLLAPRENAATLATWADKGVTAIALDAVPRMLSRAQVINLQPARALCVNAR